MGRRTIVIADENNNSGQVLIVSDWIGHPKSWYRLTAGFLAYPHGPCDYEKSKSDVNTTHTLLEIQDKSGKLFWGVRLNDYWSWGTDNDEGDGYLRQGFALQA